MALTSLLHDEGSEQIVLGLDVDMVELIERVLRDHIRWVDVDSRTCDLLNLLGDDFKAFLYLKGVQT